VLGTYQLKVMPNYYNTKPAKLKQNTNENICTKEQLTNRKEVEKIQRSFIVCIFYLLMLRRLNKKR
jgi:hypothetical protein